MIHFLGEVFGLWSALFYIKDNYVRIHNPRKIIKFMCFWWFAPLLSGPRLKFQ